jgi:hypothetical protein
MTYITMTFFSQTVHTVSRPWLFLFGSCLYLGLLPSGLGLARRPTPAVPVLPSRESLPSLTCLLAHGKPLRHRRSSPSFRYLRGHSFLYLIQKILNSSRELDRNSKNLSIYTSVRCGVNCQMTAQHNNNLNWIFAHKPEHTPDSGSAFGYLQ